MSTYEIFEKTDADGRVTYVAMYVRSGWWAEILAALAGADVFVMCRENESARPTATRKEYDGATWRAVAPSIREWPSMDDLKRDLAAPKSATLRSRGVVDL